MNLETVTWLSFWFAIVGILLSLLAITLQLLDRPRLKILSIYPGLSGERKQSDQQWKHKVTSIEVIIHNSGQRPAIEGQTGRRLALF